MNLLQNLIKFARVSLLGKDDKQYPIQQVEYNGKTKNIFMMFPYGMHANLPEDCIVCVFPVDGSEQNKFGIGGLPSERIKNLPSGEVVFFHPKTKSKIHFKNSGDIDVEASKNVNVKCNSANIFANSILDFTAPQINLNGAVNISEMVTANGGINIPTQTITVQDVDIGPSHNHSDGTYAAGSTDVTGNSGGVNP